MSKMRFDLPLEKSVLQAILPIVINPTGRMYGFYTIPKTLFTGDESSFEMSPGIFVPLQVVTMPQKVDEGNGMSGTPQFMAAVYESKDERFEPWQGFDSWIQLDDSPYNAFWQMPVWGVVHHMANGVLVDAIKFGFDRTFALDSNKAPVETLIKWSLNVNALELSPNYAYFEFNWVDLFKKAKPYAVAAGIDVVAMPPDNMFKTSLVSGQLQVGLGEVSPIMRVMRMKNVPNGDYVFDMVVADTEGVDYSVQLTVTVNS